VSIAGDWARRDLRIFLMDLGLDRPSLHEALGLPNRDGVSDAFLYGASVQRIAQPALDDSIFFASAGTATTDSRQILGHPRWNDLAGGFSEADATLLLFIPTDLPGAEKIMSRATDVLFLAGEGESPETHLGPASVKVVAMLGPMGSPPEPGEQPTAPEAASPAESDPLAGGQFGLAGDLPMEEQDEAGPDVGGFGQDLRLAEGFTRSLEEGESEGAGDGEDADASLADDFVLEIEDPARPDLMAVPPPELRDDDALLEGEVPSSPGETDPAPEPPGEALPESREYLPQEPPDFGAEFADLPPLEEDVDPGSPGESHLEDGFVSGSGVAPDQTPGEGEGSPGGGAAAGAEEAPGHEELPPTGRGYPPLPDRRKPMSRRRPPPRKRFTAPVLAGVGIVLLVLLAVLVTATGLVSVPGLGWVGNMFGEVPYPALTLEGPEPLGPELRFSVVLDTYEEEELGLAIEMRNTLRSRLPELVFYLTPRLSGEDVSYTLQAGPAADVVEAENLKGPLAEVITREDPESWPIRPTPRAFHLGERESLDAARDLAESAEVSGALGYILQVTYSDGTNGYQVLSGAFQDVEEARWWQLALRDAGFRDVPLIQRRGRPPE
jgi:hypothetical protein